MTRTVTALIPSTKLEVDKARKLVALGYPVVAPALAEMLEWVEDPSWPVAGIFLPFLAGIGAPLAPHVRYVLQTQDEQWKRVVLGDIVGASKALAQALAVDLHRLKDSPTAAEQAEGLDVLADELFWKYCGDGKA
ncbi:DUF5071 domain-containing protein [Rhodoferax sp.]|uniref:DUF5071 domain-containing protein n=1 Tax=Rhodoferax sp. TaxID=50421 RepID=UPI00277056AB|nr:DUF5071 domain-containing protein [Rhodoferax sp.]